MDTNEDDCRELGIIESFRVEDDRPSVWIFLKFPGSGQGFGGLHLPIDSGVRKSYISDLCATFGVGKLEDLVGLRCYALRSMAYGTIEGLEVVDGPVPGARFTHYAWRKKTFPDQNVPTPFDEMREDLRRAITRAKNEIPLLEERYKTLSERFRRWE